MLIILTENMIKRHLKKFINIKEIIMTPEKHKQIHIELHNYFDKLLADFIPMNQYLINPYEN